MDRPAAVVLAAGKSTRMKSSTPKVLHEVFGRPMIEYVLDAARLAGVGRIVVVVGHRAELVRDQLSGHSDVEFALQAEQKGTGHAVMVCEPQLADHTGPVLVLAGDTPLLRGESLAGLLEEQRERNAGCVIGTAITEANQGLGRVVRDSGGEFLRIVEQKDATPEEALIQEINTGCYAFDGPALLAALKEIRPDNSQAEYYLTDCPAVLKAKGRLVTASARLGIEEAIGVNTRAQLAEVHEALCQRHLERLMLENGVSVLAPAQTFIDPRVRIGEETVIHPFCTITGPVVIGKGCRIGPHAVIEGRVTIADGERVGPFEHRS